MVPVMKPKKEILETSLTVQAPGAMVIYPIRVTFKGKGPTTMEEFRNMDMVEVMAKAKKVERGTPTGEFEAVTNKAEMVRLLKVATIKGSKILEKKVKEG